MTTLVMITRHSANTRQQGVALRRAGLPQAPHPVGNELLYMSRARRLAMLAHKRGDIEEMRVLLPKRSLQ